MKKSIFFLILLTALIINVAAQQAAAQQAAAEITLNFTRQSGSASNQFAVWIEDSAGRYIKTLFVTQWTAKGGWKTREASIPFWVRKSNLSNMASAQIDAVSGATPRTGMFTCSWDGADNLGKPVPAGDYVIIIEGTLRWENQVICRAPIRIGGGQAQAQVTVEYSGDSTSERTMIGNVSVKVLR
jgi:hypothetical protein